MRHLVLLGLSGVMAGIVAHRADTLSAWSGDLASYGGVWVAGLTAIGWRARSARLAALGATVFLLGVVLGYYATYKRVAGGSPEALIAFWTGAAVTIGPGIALIAFVARRADRLGVAALSALSGRFRCGDHLSGSLANSCNALGGRDL